MVVGRRGMLIGWKIAGGLVPALVVACSLTTSFDGLTGGDGGAAPSDGSPPSDVEAPLAPDAKPEAAQDGEAAANDPTLVGYFSFDEGSGAVAADGSGHHNDAVLQSGVQWGPGRIGSAVLLAGAGGHVTVSESMSLEATNELTIAFFANLDAVSYDQRVLTKDYVYELKLNSRFPQLAAGGGYAEIGTALPPGEWHHVAFTFAQGDVHGYFDGHLATLQANTFVPGPLPNMPNGIDIGSDSQNGQLAKGKLDEVRIYARALAPAEIAALAQ